MQWFERVIEYLRNVNIYRSTMDWGDGVEILILAVLVYFILKWMKNTRAWSLLKGLLVIGVFLLFAWVFDMSTILWLARNILTFAVIAMIVVLQPELRKALETLGKKNFLGILIPLENGASSEMSAKTVTEITRACTEMAKVRTGVLIVVERGDSLKSIEETGIEVDAIVTSQLLINIFEKNTPLHDGAVVVRGNRVTSATCYLPLSVDLSLSKELGTRHRAGLGISEETDSVTVIVSEETGRISIAVDGKLERGLNGDELRQRLLTLLTHSEEESSQKRSRRRKKK